jgi:hypothetical protein
MQSLVDNTLTDKNTIHSYIGSYETLFARLQTPATRVMEIGIYDGGSIALWHNYFKSAMIYGIDIAPLRQNALFLQNSPRIKLLTGVNAYSSETLAMFRARPFDIIIDDGPHTLESMLICVSQYSNLLTDNGILVIEDVQEIEWIDQLVAATPDYLKRYIQVYDLRGNKGRYDDILFVINKGI